MFFSNKKNYIVTGLVSNFLNAPCRRAAFSLQKRKYHECFSDKNQFLRYPQSILPLVFSFYIGFFVSYISVGCGTALWVCTYKSRCHAKTYGDLLFLVFFIYFFIYFFYLFFLFISFINFFYLFFIYLFFFYLFFLFIFFI